MKVSTFTRHHIFDFTWLASRMTPMILFAEGTMVSIGLTLGSGGFDGRNNGFHIRIILPLPITHIVRIGNTNDDRRLFHVFHVTLNWSLEQESNPRGWSCSPSPKPLGHLDINLSILPATEDEIRSIQRNEEVHGDVSVLRVPLH